MKNLFSFLVFVICITAIENNYAQNVAINATGSPATPTAILDITSTTKGVLVPRMSTIERNLIPAPAQGLLVYDLDSRNFWFYDGGWNQISSGGGGLPSGPASGDLSGNYPSPNVVRIQNLDVASGVPFDKQVMKWDALANNWKGRNDSLFLPYNVAFGSPTKLFGIQNNNTSNGASAICGKSGTTGSGIIPGNTMGVWGDNSTGLGVIGTSNTGIGAYGFSFGNHGVYGYSTLANFAGVCGSHANPNGIGVLGDIQNSGKAVYGRSTGSAGIAGYFENTASGNFDNALKVSTAGNGAAAYFTTSCAGHAGYFTSTNVNSTYPIVMVNNISKGTGISVAMSAATTSHGIYIDGQGTGTGVYSLADIGQAGLFNITNVNNDKSSLNASTVGKGIAATFVKNNSWGAISDVIDPAVKIDNTSKGNALKISSLFPTSVNSGVDINYDGQSYGLSVGSTSSGIHAVSQSTTGAAIIAEDYAGGFAIKAYNNSSSNEAIHTESSQMFGVGLKSVVTGSQAIGVLATANSAQPAVSGKNACGGPCVYGLADTTPGGISYGVRGETNSVSWGIPGQFISNCPTANTNTLWMIDKSLGQTVRIQTDNAQNNNEALYVRHEGTGKLAAFDNSTGEVFAVANNGNVTSKGTMTVKGNKGIIRNSSATQLRMETVTSPTVSSAGLGVGGSVSVTITFGTAFSSPPSVSVANISTGFVGACDSMCTAIKDVTTTGCTLKVFNAYMSNSGVISGTWKLNVIGAE